MKKIALLTIASLCIVLFANAQINKGALYLGGNLGFSSATETEIISTSTTANKKEGKGIRINPAIGWAIKQNLIFGVEFNYNKSSIKYSISDHNIDSRFTGGSVFLRRYFHVGKRFYAFGQVGAGYADTYNKQSNSSSFNNIDYKTDGWNTFINFYPGISYNLSKSFFLEMGLANLFNASYGKEKEIQTSPNSTTTFTTDRKLFNISTSLAGSTNLNIGFRFIIPHK